MYARYRRLAAVIAAFAALTVVLAACGSSDSSSSTSTPSTSTPASTTAASGIAVPAKYKDKGSLTVAADASYPPNESIGPDGKTVIGADPDLAHAIAAAMGLKANVVNATFDAIIPGLAAGKYDLGMSSFTDTKEREQTVDFVTYFNAGTSFYTSASKPANVTGLDSLCGLTVAAEKGTTQADDANAQSKKCKAAGKDAVNVLVFQDQSGANLAIAGGKADVGMADSPVAAGIVKKSGGKFKLVGQTYGEAPYGIAIPKNSGLAEPVLAAVKKIIADGTYLKILTKWGIQDGAITDPKINGATS